VCLFLFLVIGPVLILKLQDGVDQILNRKMSISYYVFPVVLEQGYGHIEQLFTSCLLRIQHLAKLLVGNRIFTPVLTKFEYVLEVVFFAQHICVDSVHGYCVVVDALPIQGLPVQLQVVTLQHLVFVKRERIFHSHVLDVLVRICLRNLFESWIRLKDRTLVGVALRLVLRLADELIQHRHILELLHLYLKNMLDLLVGLSWIL